MAKVEDRSTMEPGNGDKNVKPLDLLKIILAMTTAFSTGMLIRAEVARVSESNLRVQYDYVTENVLGRLKNHETSIIELGKTQQALIANLDNIIEDVREIKTDVKTLLSNGH